MYIYSVGYVRQIPFTCNEDELSVVPVVNYSAICFTLHDVTGELIMKTRYEQWRYPTNGRQPVLKDVIENFFIKRKNIFEFNVAKTVLGGSQV